LEALADVLQLLQRQLHGEMNTGQRP
jgi:hypothetical protein